MAGNPPDGAATAQSMLRPGGAIRRMPSSTTRPSAGAMNSGLRKNVFTSGTFAEKDNHIEATQHFLPLPCFEYYLSGRA